MGLNLHAMLAIASRDLIKFLRDPARLIWTLIFPLLLIGIFGQVMQANLGQGTSFNFLAFTFSGVFAQTLFMSAAQGVVSLIEDRENDFSQEMFVSPVSRHAIIFGKVLGETLVALPQGAAIILLGWGIGVLVSVTQLFMLAAVALAVCLFGGAFGVILVANFSSQRAANQVVPMIMIPQFFLGGVFTPIRVLPWYLDVLSHLSPLRYAVDLVRGVFYADSTEHAAVVLQPPLSNAVIMAAAFAVFLMLGTFLFVHGERNR